MNESQSWDAEFRPRLMRRAAYAVSAVIAVAGIVVSWFNRRSSGAYMRVADQIAWGGVAVLIAAAILVLLTRPRVRVGSAGIQVRNVVEDRLIPWSNVVDVSFPKGKRWARVDLEAYEYVPLVAVQAVDRERAVSAMDTMRQLMARYRPGPGRPPD
ncbi:MAG: PH domain-containing protein [Mycobacterium sp.]